MSQHPLRQPVTSPPVAARPDARVPALVCAAGAAGHVLLALVAFAVPSLGLGLGAEPVLWFAVLLAVLHVQQLAGVLALARSGFAGSGAAGRAGLGLAATGGALFMAGELVYLADAGTGETVFGLASLTSALGLVLAGVAVLRARRWPGPARFLPVALGTYIVAVLTPLLVATPFGLLGIAGWAVLWVLLGLGLYHAAQPR